MAVGRQGLDHPRLAHKDEANCVAKRVGLVDAAREEVYGLAMEFLVDIDHIEEEAVHHTLEKFEDRSARKPSRLGQRNEFRQHELCVSRLGAAIMSWHASACPVSV
jgi:hypothetical protein